VPTARVKEFESGLYRFIETEHPDIFKTLEEKPELTDEVTAAITSAIDQFRRDVFGLEEPKPADKAATPASEKKEEPAKEEPATEEAAASGDEGNGKPA
jgi:hypothetical protein